MNNEDEHNNTIKSHAQWNNAIEYRELFNGYRPDFSIIVVVYNNTTLKLKDSLYIPSDSTETLLVTTGFE